MSSTSTAEPVQQAWDEQAADRICDRLAVLAGQLNLVNAQLTELVADALSTGLWQMGAVKSPEHWLAWKTGVSPERAREIVRVARARVEFPTIVDAFDHGQLSLEQVSVAVKAPSWADAQLLDLARISTVAKLRREVRPTNFEPDPDQHADTPESSSSKSMLNSVSFGATGDGRWRIRGTFDVLTGQRLQAALEERRDALYTAGDTAVTWVDALIDCCQRSLDTIESASRRDQYRTWIHLDTTNTTTSTTGGWQIPMALADQILCDGVIQPVWEHDGVPFSVGRSQRIVPDRTRRIIERRDRGCRVPGCDATRHVEIHHIIHWLDGGPTDTSNLISLCPRHHKMHHHGLLGITGNADHEHDITFTDQHGQPITTNGQPDPTESPPQPTEPYHNPLRRPFRRQGEWIHPTTLKRRADTARQAYQQQHAA